MDTDFNIKYNLKKLNNNKYSLSIKGNMRWVSGFVLFMVFTLFLTAAFFLPMGYSIKNYLKLVIPLFSVFTFIAILAGYVFKKKSEKNFIFDSENYTITQSKKNESENWEVLQLPKNGIIIRDYYKYLTRNVIDSTVTDTLFTNFINRNRLMVIPIDDKNSKDEILQKIIDYERSIIGEIYRPKKEPTLPENAILISDSRFSPYQDLLIEGLVKIFDWELVDFLNTKPEIYNKKTLNEASLDTVLENIEKPDKAPGVREKVKRDKIIFTLNRIPLYLKIIVLIVMAALSSFYAFFAAIKNDTPFLVGFTPIFLVWFLVLSFKIKIYVTKNSISKRLSLFGIPVTPKVPISTSDIGDIKIKRENNYDLVIYKKGTKQPIFTLTVSKKASAEYIIYRIVEFLKQ